MSRRTVLRQTPSIYGELKQYVQSKAMHPLKASSLIATAVTHGHAPPELDEQNLKSLQYVIGRYFKRDMPRHAMDEISRTLARNLITEYRLLNHMAEEYLDCLVTTLPVPRTEALKVARRSQLQRAVEFLQAHEEAGRASQLSVLIYERLVEKCTALDDVSLVQQLMIIARRNGISLDKGTWNRYLCKAHPNDVVSILEDMYQDNIELDPRSVIFLLKTLRGKQRHGHSQLKGMTKEEFSSHTHRIIDVAKVMGAYNEYIAVEEMLLLKDEGRFSDVIAVFTKEYGSDLLRQFGFQVPEATGNEERPSAGKQLEITKYSLSILLDALVQINPHPKSLFALRRAYVAYTKDKKGYADDVYGPSIFIRAFANHTSTIPKALNLLEMMRARRTCNPQVVSYTNVIEGLCKNHMMDLAERVLAYMRTDGIAPNKITYGILLKGYTAINHADGIAACKRMLSLMPSEQRQTRVAKPSVETIRKDAVETH